MNNYILIDLSLIEPEMHDWVRWLEQEKKDIRRRFGNDAEAIKFWSDDYYDRMEKWWKSERRFIDPISCTLDKDNIYRIADGWHRIAISHKIGLKIVPVTIVNLINKKNSED